MAYYFPSGNFGPICDALVDDSVISARSRAAITDVEDLRVEKFPPPPPDYYKELEDIFDPAPAILLTELCKRRVLEDGTVELYDCLPQYLGPYQPYDPPLIDVDGANSKIGLTDEFFIPTITPESCSPFDEDINIRPTTFFTTGGTAISRNKRERSSPVTYPVVSETEAVTTTGDLDANFQPNGDLYVTGTGTANIQLNFEWNDNPNTYGQALGSYSIGGITFTQTSGVSKGSDQQLFSTSAANLTATIVQGTGYGGFVVENSGKQLCFRDLDGNDCNARLTITSITSVDTVSNGSYWSDEGNEYGVWVNPQVCTLPREEQIVTYFVDIPATDTYAFRFGCDDNATLFLNDESTPFLTAIGGIFDGGTYNTPYTGTRNISAGKLKITVRCTNSDAGFQDSEGLPTGLAYSWQRNPGGWFIKICRGGACEGTTTIAWVRSGPHQAWGDFMNEYAVYVSNIEPEIGTHTGTWNFTTPHAGNYQFEYAADNNGTYTLDGNQIATSSNFTSSNTITLNNLSKGNHTLVGQIENVSNATENSWAFNPAGIAWKLTIPASTISEEQSVTTTTESNLSASWASNGDLIVDGTGSGKIQLLFEWDDNPYTAGTALGLVTVNNLTFRQTSGQKKGSRDRIFDVTAGSVYSTFISDNPGGFSVQGDKLCFRDLDGNDCNAELKILKIINDPPTTSSSVQTVQVTVPEQIIASSLDLTSAGSGNLIWHTRMATGYEYY